MKQRIVMLFFVALMLGGSIAIGYLTRPGEWYAQLAKPDFTPPGWLFGPVWTLLYIMIGIAGWRAWRTDRRGWPLRLWWVQLGLNFLWSPVFFTAHQIGLALIVILLLLVAILGFIASSWRRDRVAAFLFAPYAVWVAFASMLNGSILASN
jgi:benzodiazapine receptor